jgi:isochorismate pyruvate lyase
MGERAAAECSDLSQVRYEIDCIDVMLVDLIANRFKYIDRASQLKQHPDEALIEWRIEDVVDKVRARARTLGLPSDLVEPLWRQMMDWFVHYEAVQLASRADTTFSGCNGRPEPG